REAAERLKDYDDGFDHYGRPLAPFAGLVLFALLVLALFAALPRAVARSTPFAVGAAFGAVAVFFVALLPLISRLESESEKAEPAARRDHREAQRARAPAAKAEGGGGEARRLAQQAAARLDAGAAPPPPMAAPAGPPPGAAKPGLVAPLAPAM